jgi:hypothetical protein
LNELPGRSERSLVAQLVFGHYRLKLLAVAASMTLYVFVHGGRESQRVVDYDVLAVLPTRHDDQVLVSSLPAKLRVTLQGPSSALRALEPQKLKPIPMDLRNYRGPTFAFDRKRIAVPSRIEVARIDPAQVALVWRPRAHRAVPVRLQLIGAPRNGFARVTSLAGPTLLDISGPDDEVAAARELVTHEVSVAGLESGAHELVTTPARLPGHLECFDTAPVRARIQIGSAP